MVQTRIHKKHRLIAMFFVLVLLVHSIPSAVFAEGESEVEAAESESKTTLQGLEEKYDQLKEQLAGISEGIEQAQNDKAVAADILESLRAEQAVILEMISINQHEIEVTQTQLESKQNEVAKIRAELYNNDQLYQQRLVAIYEMNNVNVLSQALSVESFTDFFQVVDAMRLISERDTELLRQQSERKADLEAEESKIQGEINTLLVVHEELGANNTALEQNQSYQQNLISDAEYREATLEDDYDATYAELEKAQEEMEAARRAMAATGSQQGDGSQFIGGVFQWPVPGFYNITCYFGAPDPNGTPHRGMDISGGGVLGANIVACGNGTVITASSHSSYGNYIVIDHGDGVKTLYAHCTSLLRGVGEYVTAGEPIATVGSTGFSTGPHLHLEVQTGGGLQNPLEYLR